MSDIDSDQQSTRSNIPPEVLINPRIAARARLPFTISILSFFGLLVVIFIPILSPILQFNIQLGFDFTRGMGTDSAAVGPFLRLTGYYFPHLLLFVICVVSGYIGYKILVASGASTENPIPPGNYRLLAPLITDGKAESIDQYVRLSSLSGFTGTFTKLGLTGLPLTTVGLTLVFAALSLLPIGAEEQKNFMDLTKLVLGAFIGSFVQRQVEQRRAAGADTTRATPTDQSKPSSSSS